MRRAASPRVYSLRETRQPIVALGSGVVVLAALYFGSPLLIPLAAAVLLAFVLDPAVSRIERLGLSRVLATALVFVGAIAALGLLAWLVVGELARLVTEIPDLRANLVEKVRALRGPLRSLADATGWMEQLSREVEVGRGASPPKVEVVESSSALTLIGSFVTPLLAPAASIAATFVLALFLLLERDALRTRLSRFLGSRELPMTSRALDDAGERVSRYLLRQVLLCALHGSAVAAGAWWIGIPGPLLCGGIAGVLRLVPYIGPWIGAGLPTALAAAAVPGWSAVLQTVGFLVVLEIISNNLLEPWIYGRGTGLSPFGVVLAAFFWAFMWGPAGLVLAVPITVCLVVFGRYVPQLSLLSAFLGDEPVVPDESRFYECLVCHEVGEAGRLLTALREERDLVALSDAVVLPTLVRIVHDRERRLSSRARATQTALELEALLDALTDDPAPETAVPDRGAVWLAAAQRDPVEECALRWLARVLRARGAQPQQVALDTLLAETDALPALRAVSALGRSSASAAVERLRRGPPRQQDRLVLASFGGAADGLFSVSARVHVAHTCAELVAELEQEAEPTPEARSPSTNAAGEREVAELDGEVAEATS